MDRCAQVGRGRIEVVRVAECEHIPPVAADEAYPTRDLVELVEVEREIEDRVLELVRERPCTAVPHDPLQQVRPHAASSRAPPAISSAAANPERQPSSWNPYPRCAPA